MQYDIVSIFSETTMYYICYCNKQNELKTEKQKSPLKMF